MTWANNLKRKERDKATQAEFKILAGYGGEAFDLLSFFRVQYVVMYHMTGCPVFLREFLIAIYFGQKVRGWTFMREVGRLCPHIRRTNLETLYSGGYVSLVGSRIINKFNHRVQAIALTNYWFNKIDKAMKEAQKTIQKEQKKGLKIADSSQPGTSFLDEFIDL